MLTAKISPKNPLADLLLLSMPSIEGFDLAAALFRSPPLCLRSSRGRPAYRSTLSEEERERRRLGKTYGRRRPGTNTQLLDRSCLHESWDGYFFQDGFRFYKHTLETIPTDGPPPVQPERLNPRERRTPVIWKKRQLNLQNGWAFDPATLEAVKINGK